MNTAEVCREPHPRFFRRRARMLRSHVTFHVLNFGTHAKSEKAVSAAGSHGEFTVLLT